MKTKLIQSLLFGLIYATAFITIFATFKHHSVMAFVVGSIVCIGLNAFRKSIIADIKEDERGKHLLKSIKP